MRLDVLIFERGLAESRTRAQALIMAGKVYVDDKRCDKAGQEVTEDSFIEVRGSDHPFVSRGGVKLEAAIKGFGIVCQGKTALDVGASTGGFTDCLLQNGARKVYALDVGFGQLDWRLRQDERVVVIERTNIRHLDPEQITVPLDLVTIDCSFISLRLVLSQVSTLIPDGANAICLIKPQFEVGRGEVGKGGVIREREKHERVLRETAAFAIKLGFSVKGLIPSPIKGPKGNREFLIHLIWRENQGGCDLECAIQTALNNS